mmetsp:Transcript_5323/g.14405  ORF Transcript_5323/g.14405 Transcript_5323/m.14405 type:complete len:199 (+) Transcript_5323:131-727(+)
MEPSRQPRTAPFGHRAQRQTQEGPEQEANGRFSGEEAPRGMLGCGPTTENIVIWSSAQIFHREERLLVEPGRFFYCGVPRNVDQRIHDMLQPVFEHIHRDDHSERHAFLAYARAIVRRVGYEGLPDVSGRIGMYVAHFPCISCVAVICQFIRFFPSVRLDMDFDNMWKSRWRYGTCRERVAGDSSFRGVKSLSQRPLL